MLAPVNASLPFLLHPVPPRHPAGTSPGARGDVAVLREVTAPPVQLSLSIFAAQGASALVFALCGAPHACACVGCGDAGTQGPKMMLPGESSW